MMVSKVR